MVAVYCDTSAIVKLYLEESCSGEVEAAVAKATIQASSILSYVEVHSALTRRFREDRYPLEERRSILDRFEQDWPGYTTVDVSHEIIERGAILTVAHHLRAYGAVHLASALEVQRSIEEPVTFLAFDRPLLTAAKKEGLTLDR